MKIKFNIFLIMLILSILLSISSVAAIDDGRMAATDDALMVSEVDNSLDLNAINEDDGINEVILVEESSDCDILEDSSSKNTLKEDSALSFLDRAEKINAAGENEVEIEGTYLYDETKDSDYKDGSVISLDNIDADSSNGEAYDDSNKEYSVETLDEVVNEISTPNDSNSGAIDDVVPEGDSNVNAIDIGSSNYDSDNNLHYGYWANGRFLTLFNFKEMADNGVTDIFINYFIYRTNTMDVITQTIAEARKYNINIHIWTQIFWETGVWTLPVDENGDPNMEFFETKIEELKMIARTPGLYGINFDYLRFSGCQEYSGEDTWDAAEDYPRGIESIALFRTMAIEAIKEINPDIKISSCVGPARDHYEDWFGFNYENLTAAVDIIVPMLYTGSFYKDPQWVYDEALWHLNHTKGAEVWIGLLGYINDNDMEPVPSARINTEINKVLETSAKGVMVFKWNWTEDINFNNLTVDGEELNSLKYLDYEIRFVCDELNLTHDYAYNEKYDEIFVNGFNLGNKTINGNNHTIDFKNKTFALVNSTNLIIKDLKIINYNNQIDVIINELNMTKESLISANKQIETLNNQVKTLNSKVNVLNTKVKTLNSKITKLNTQLSKAKEVIKIKTVKSAKKVKRTSKKFVITVTLNKKLKNRNVFFIFNGRTYVKKTNYKGVAILKLTKSVFKKLKIGKLRYNVIFGERMVQRTVNILK